VDVTPVPVDLHWYSLPPGLRRLRRTVLLVVGVPLTALAGLLPGVLAGGGWALLALLPAALVGWGWRVIGRNWASWRFAEREDDLLLVHGVLWRRQLVVPYGRMQAVDVEAGPLERAFGVASVQLHTAAPFSAARIPGLLPAEAERLRDALAERGEARQAGL
jgi:membrane protein YdbS with pleckstrin-like domain